MQIKTFILSAILGAVATTSGFAQRSVNNDPRDAQAQQQGYYSQPYAFVQAQGGLNTLLAAGNEMKPTFSIAGGYMFTHAVGLRLHINGIGLKNGFETIGDKYQFKYINTNFDMMLNLTNLGKNPAGPLNVYFIAGIGLAYCWDNNEFSDIARRGVIKEDISNAWNNDTRKDLISHNIRAGLLVDYNITKDLSVGAEFDFNNLSDRFDSKYKDGTDWMATGQISLTYKFGYKAYGSDRVFPTSTKKK